MKHLNILLSILILTCAKLSLYSAPHQLNDNFEDRGYYVIDSLVKKEKIKIYLDPSVDKDMSVYYQQFFNNILSRIETTPNAKEDLKDIMDIIEFGANPDSYEKSTTKGYTNDISFFFVKKTSKGLEPHCPKYAAACFWAHNGSIYLPILENQGKVDSLALHEIGHSLRLRDIYEGEFELKAGRYGSGRKPSIMNNDYYLTCDDADAIINSIWLTLKQSNPNQPDLSFNSLCNDGASFRNAQQKNKKPLLINRNGSRMFYIYCKNGNIKSTVLSTPHNPEKFYIYTEENPGCEALLPTPAEIKPEEGFSYTIKDFNTGKIIKEGGHSKLMEHNTYMELPGSGGLVLQIAERKHGIPAYVALTDSNNVLLTLFAYLDNGYNIFFSFFVIDTDYRTNPGGKFFIYNRQDPEKQFYSYVPERQETENDKNNPMRNILNDYYKRLSKSHNIILPRKQEYAYVYRDYAIEWEKWLLENSFVLKNKKLVGEVKPLKEGLKIDRAISADFLNSHSLRK